MSVPVFSNRASLSLAALDAMGDIVRKNEQTLQSIGAGPRLGAAKPAPAWYVPSPVAGVGSAVGFTCVSPGTIGAVDISRAYEVPLIINGKLHIPMAHNRVNHEIDPEDVTVDYLPGAVDSIDVREGTAATLEHGTICLPLAQSPETEADDITGEEYEVTAGWAGLLAAAEFTSGISSPVMQAGNLLLPLAEYTSGVSLESQSSVAGAIAGVEYVPDLTDPDIRSGVLRLPPATGGNRQLAEFVGTVSSVGGGLLAATISSVSEISAHSGVLYFPLAESNDYPCSVATPGALAGAEINSSLTKPEICSGVLYFPATDGGNRQLAEFVGTVSSVGGGLLAATISSVSEISAHNGVLYFPLAESNDYPCSVATPGALAGVEINSSLTNPEICSGVLYFPATGGGDLKGFRDLEGTYHTFGQGIYVGAQVPVAAITLRADDSYITLKLCVGYEEGYLDFSFTTEVPM